MDYQVETIGKTIIPVFIDPVTFCILSNNCNEIYGKWLAEQNQIYLSQAQSYCHVHCHSQPGLSGLFLLAA